MRVLLTALGPCPRCGGQYVDAGDAGEAPRCFQCGHFYRSTLDLALIAELAAEPTGHPAGPRLTAFRRFDQE